MTTNTKGGSLQRQLLLKLWVPMLVVLTLGGVTAFALARHIGSVVYDRWLYDSATTLAREIKNENMRPSLRLPKTALDMFEWDSVDRIYEQVVSETYGTILKNADFPAPPSDLQVGRPSFYDSTIDGHSVRVVAVKMPSPDLPDDTIVIQVAETKNKRASLVTEAVLLFIPLQLGILLMARAFILFAVKSSLRTLDNVTTKLDSYEAEGPIPEEDPVNVPSEVRPLIDAINRLIGKLSAARDNQRRFVSNAAHQLRTPLATLQVQTERTLREEDPTKHRDALGHVLGAVTRLRHVVHQLLTLARSDDSGEHVLQLAPVDLVALTKDELERWTDHAIAQQVDLGYEGSDLSQEIAGVPQLLRELIANLIDNAIRYGRPRGVVTVGVSASPPTLYVEDDGPGIPEAERPLVLERFYRRSDAAGDGCGLGLAIAVEIAARHNAVLSILDNPRGQGVRIAVVFPEQEKTA